MIKKIGDKYKVTTSSGDETLGTHSTKKAALAQLAAVEISKAKHMSEDKSFKSFRTTLSEAEYGEYVTGNSHRSAYNDDGTYRIQNPKMLNSINAMLAAIGHATYTDPMEAFNKIRVRLNVFLLDLDWKTFSDLKNKDVGSFVLPINRFGRVDGYDGNSGELRFDGKARDAEGLPAVNLHVNIELTPDYLYTVHACLRPQGAAPPRSTISAAAATLKRNESVEQVDEVKGLIDVSTRPIKPRPTTSTRKRVRAFARRLMNLHGISAAATHKGANFQPTRTVVNAPALPKNEEYILEYTNDDVQTSHAAATLRTKIGKAETAGETTRINPSEDPNAAARAAHRAATTIRKGTNKLRRLNKIKTNEDTISEQEKVPFPSGGRNVRFSGLALKTMGQHSIKKSPETASRFRKALERSTKRDAIRNARKARKTR